MAGRIQALRRILRLVCTAAAEPVEIRHMTGDAAVEVLGGGIVDFLHAVYLQIQNLAAFLADKVVMGRNITIETVNPVAYVQPAYLALLGQKRKIAVYGAQTDARVLIPHVPITCICSRVIFSGFQKGFYQFPLPAVSPCSHPMLLCVFPSYSFP